MFKPGDLVGVHTWWNSAWWNSVPTMTESKVNPGSYIDISAEDVGLVIKKGTPTHKESFLVLFKGNLVSFHPDNLYKISK